MSYSVPCECGLSLEVTAAQAGSDAACKCGRTVSVPLLSTLRRLAGQDEFEAGVIDTINRMIREGELPWGETCAISGRPTSESVDLYVQCEFRWFQGTGSERYLYIFFTLLLLPFRILWIPFGKLLAEEEHRELGRDRGVYAPLRVRREHHQQLSRTRNQAKLRQWLRTVPIYAKLLDEYPKARITTPAAR